MCLDLRLMLVERLFRDTYDAGAQVNYVHYRQLRWPRG